MDIFGIKEFGEIKLPVRIGFKNGDICGIVMKVDTGADISVISYYLIYDICSDLIKSLNGRKTEYLGNAGPSAIEGYYVDIQEFFITHRGFKNLNSRIFIATNVHSKLLLGRDLLDFYKYSRDPDNESFTISSRNNLDFNSKVESMTINDKKKYEIFDRSILKGLKDSNMEVTKRDLAVNEIQNPLAEFEKDIFADIKNKEKLIKNILKYIAPAILSNLNEQEIRSLVHKEFLRDREFYIKEFLRLSLISVEETEKLRDL